MKKFILWAFLFPIALFAQNANLYTIQIGTFVNPKVTDFQLIQPFGYLYAEPAGDNFSKVYLGEFKTLPETEAALIAVKGKGYRAFIAEKLLVDGKEMIVVQFTTEKVDIPINWKKFKPVGKLYTLIEDSKRIKIVSGPFDNMATARKRTAEIQQLGYKDAFIKKVNSQLLHEVNSFELGRDPIKKDLNEVVETILRENAPQNYGKISPKKIPTKHSINIAPTLPHIKATIKRTAALDIQKVLKSANYYAGSLDGLYGKRTAAAYQKFEENDFQFKKYELLASYYNTNNKKQPTNFQRLLNNLLDNPNVILADLRSSKEPLAKAYQAYWLLVTEGATSSINNLMNAAIKSTFANKKLKNSPPFDFNVTYSYNDLEQFILHLRYLHAAPNNTYRIPCWLFERHPNETFAAFKTKSKFASFAGTKIAGCKNFDDWKSLKIMNTIIADLQPESFSEEELSRQATLEAGRSFLYLFPEKLDKNQKKETEKWLRNFWASLDNSATIHPVLAKQLPTLKALFFQSQLLLEDFYIDKKFSADEAEGLALSVLKTYVDVPLGVYVGL